jgi:hypothetical protein
VGKAQKYVDTLIEILQDIKQSYEYNQINIGELDGESADLEHEIELSKFDSKRGYKLAKEYQRVRQERRKLKDENETLKFLYEHFSKLTLITDLQSIRGAIKKETEKMTNRLYKPHIRNDLTIPTMTNVTNFKNVGGL